MTLRVEAATTADELLGLREPWERLSAAGGALTPFQTWPVMFHAWRMQASVVSPLVLVARSGPTQVDGILPLGVRASRVGPFRWRDLETIAPTSLDFIDVVALPDRARDVLQACVDWLATNWRRWDGCQLKPVREDALILRHARELRVPAFLHLSVESVAKNQALSIPAGAQGWEDTCQGEHRRITRRTLNRLQADGFCVRRVSAGHPITEAVDALVALHTQRRGEHGETSRLAGVDKHALSALVVDALECGGDLMIMEQAGAAVAAQLTLRSGDRVSHYRVAFDSAFRRWSPGIGLLVAALDDAAKTGVREYDFGFGAEEYKRRWADVKRDVFSLRLENRHTGRTPRRAWLWSRRLLLRSRRQSAEPANA